MKIFKYLKIKSIQKALLNLKKKVLHLNILLENKKFEQVCQQDINLTTQKKNYI